MALAEAYPDLKANANFVQLQGSLGELEEAIQNSRRYYNAVVRDLNTAVQTFPSNFIASFFQFHRSEEHTSELQSRLHLVCRLLLEKKKKTERTIANCITNLNH